MHAFYDTIGIDYANLRRPDDRIAAQIWRAMGSARKVLNVGAGTGSYEPVDREVTAIEPSIEMIRQRSNDAAPVIHGVAENLPFADNSFDAAMAILTVHHWSDRMRGLAELRRVSRGPVVILTYDRAHRGNWLADYFPDLVELDEKVMPPMVDYASALGAVEISPVLIPHDCTDGFLYAYWRRPRAYLDPQIRKGSSAFHILNDLSFGLKRLEADIASGTWEQRYAECLALDSCDLGYRLVSAN